METTTNALITKHNLDFEACDWEPLAGMPASLNWMRFRVGTCEGLWAATPTSYDILAVNNDNKGNGHLDDVFQWFEFSCKRDKRDLRVLECMNKHFLQHLITKRGFQRFGSNNAIKKLKKL